MVVVRGVLVPFSGIWNAVYRHAHGRGGRGPLASELRGAVCQVACECHPRMAGQPGPKGIHTRSWL